MSLPPLPHHSAPLTVSGRGTPDQRWYEYWGALDKQMRSTSELAGDAVPTSLTLTAGAGLTGGGDLSANRTFAVGAGTGIQVNADSIEVKYGTTAGTAAEGNDSRITGAAQKSANLSDLVSASDARDNLGLGTAAVEDTSAFDAAGAASSAVSAHESALDPHPQYLTETEADAAYAALNHDHVAADITDFATAVSSNSDVSANTSARHDAVTVTDSSEIDFTLTGQEITASLKLGAIASTKLDAGVQASLGKADTALQSTDIGTLVQAYSATLDAVAGGTYTGDDSITTVGTIGTGTWQGTAIGVAYGGTGATSASGTALDNITGFSSTGLLQRTGSGTYAFITLDTDGTLAANSDSRVATQKAVNTFVVGKTFVATVARSSDTTLVASNHGATIIATGTFAQTFAAASTLGDGWWCRYRNAGTGIITFDPNSSETINGAATLKLFPGEDCTLVCNGTALHAIGLSAAPLVFDSGAISPGSSSVDFVLDVSRFTRFEVATYNLLPSTHGDALWLRVSTDGGANFHAGNTDYAWNVIEGVTLAADYADNQIRLCSAVSANFSRGASIFIDLGVPPGAAINVVARGRFLNSGEAETIVSAAGFGVAGVNAAQLLFSSGTIASGRVKVRGMLG